MANGVSVKIDISDVDFDSFGHFTRKAIESYMDEKKESVESYMRRNAKWNDRTGNARRGLRAEVNLKDEDGISMELSHSVDYGVFLEYAMEQRYAILEPTVRLKGPEVIKGLNGLLNKRKYFRWL